jgi:hypothetical protein
MLSIVLGLLLVLVILFILLALFNYKLPVWACYKMGWHLAPEKIGFDGCSCFGLCPRCGHKVLQDSQGNWFGVEN